MVDGALNAAHVLLSLTVNQTNSSSSVGSVQAATVISWLSFVLGLPALGVAIYTLHNLSKGGRKVPPHVTLLLISDVLSFLGRPAVGASSAEVSPPILSTSITPTTNLTDLIFYSGLVSNICLMVFIAQERHLLVAFPQCAGSSSSCRTSQVFVAFKWAVPFGVLTLAILRYTLWFAIALLVPFPFFLLFSLDSWRALACSRSNPATAERKRAVYGIAAIWANYSIIYLPYILSVLFRVLEMGEAVEYLELVSHLLLYLGPLVDPFLYMFLTEGPKEVLRALNCCNYRQTHHREEAVETVSQIVDTRF